MYYAEERTKAIRQAQDETLRKDSLAEGFAKGRAEGMAKGRAEGEAMKARDTAKKLLVMGMSIGDIANVTGLTTDEIRDMAE